MQKEQVTITFHPAHPHADVAGQQQAGVGAERRGPTYSLKLADLDFDPRRAFGQGAPVARIDGAPITCFEVAEGLVHYTVDWSRPPGSWPVDSSFQASSAAS